MKLNDTFYQELYGIGGLNFESAAYEERKDPGILLNTSYICETEEFIYPFQGKVKKINWNSAIVSIEQTTGYDRETAQKKDFLTVVPFKKMYLAQ
jgi:uncharacterized protein YkvS